MSAREALASATLLFAINACGCGEPPPPTDRRELYDFVREPGNRTSCRDWVVPPHITTSLALAPPGTAEVLWTWSPASDPLLASFAHGGNIEALALSPDGSLWAIGPDQTAVLNLGPDGHARVMQRLIDFPARGSIAGPIRVSPDGDAWVDLEPARTVRVTLGGSYYEIWNDQFTGLRHTVGAFGPDGVAYIYETTEDSGWTIATCGGSLSQVLWRAQVRTPWAPQGLPVEILLTAEGTSSLTSFEDATLRFDMDGTVQWLSEPTRHDSSVSTYRYAIARDHASYQTGAGMNFRQRILAFDGTETWSIDLPYGTGTRVVDADLDNLGRILLTETESGVGRFSVLDASGTLIWDEDAVSRDRPLPSTFVEGGGWVGGTGHQGPGAGVARIDASGARPWHVTIGDPGDGGGTGLLDVDGRYYAMILGGTPTARIVLLQTDALPDQGEICMDAPLVPFCNAYHSNWMHLYQPTPPAE